MLRRLRCMFIVTSVASLLTLAVASQKAPRVKYDPSTQTTISGVIEEVKEFQCPVSGTLGYHLVLKSHDQLVTVHVAASKFLRDYEISFAKGDQIEVLGSKVTLESGEQAVLAKEIKRGQNTYAFRDKDGNPLW